MELQYHITIQYLFFFSFFLNGQQLAFFILFRARNFIVLSLHAPRTDRWNCEIKRCRNSIFLILLLSYFRCFEIQYNKINGALNLIDKKSHEKGVRENATDKVISRVYVQLHFQFIKRSVAFLRTICCLLFFFFLATRTNTIRGGNRASTHCHSYENEIN